MRRLDWSDESLVDLDRIAAYIALYDRPASRRVVKAIRASLERVREHPLSAPLNVDLGLRKLTVTRYPYVVLYRPTVSFIEIARVHHAAENWRPT